MSLFLALANVRVHTRSMFGIAFKITGRLADGGVTVLTPINGLLHTPGWLVYPGQREWLLGEVLRDARKAKVPVAAASAVVDAIMKEVEG